MADKFPSTVNAFINFVAGEQPTADKFNALVAQTKYGFSGLEAAVGDIHSASWPYIADDIGTSSTRLTIPFYRNRGTGDEVTGADSEGRSLDIVSLARLIGPASNLNPLVLDADHQVVNEQVSSSDVTEFQLRYPVEGSISTSNPSFSNDTNSSLTSYKSNVKDVKQDGDYHVNSDGSVFCFKPIAAGLTATYDTDPTSYAGGPNYSYARLNVIPDPNQVASSSSEKVVVTSAGADGLHTVQLPLITHQQTNYFGNTASLSEETDLNYQVQAKLPFVLTENMTIGQSIPSGFLYLKNVTTNEVYTDATYIYNDEDTFQVGNVDLEDRITAGDTFQVLTVGTDITSAILDLQFKLFKHKHNRAHGEPGVRVSDLVNNYKYKGASGTFMPSTMNGNNFAQYLHRDGYRPDDENTICNDANAMRGNLVFGRILGPPGEYVVGDNGVTTRTNTFGICFGGNPGDAYPDTSYGPVISGNSTAGITTNLHIKTEDNSSSHVQIFGQGNFIVNMDEDVNIIAEESVSLESENSNVDIDAGNDIYMSCERDMILTADDDIILRVDPSATGGSHKIILDCPGWATIAEDGGTSGIGKGVIVCDSDSDTGMDMWTNNGLFQVRAPNNDGSIVTFDNTSNGTSYDGNILLLRHTDQSSAGSVGTNRKQWIRFEAMVGSSVYTKGMIRSFPTGHDKSTSPRYSDGWGFSSDGSAYTEDGLVALIGKRQDNGDVAYVSGSADFGEMVLLGDSEEWSYEMGEDYVSKEGLPYGLPEGLVVFVREGKFWRTGSGTPMVVTNRAAFIGNMVDKNELYETLSFCGTVPTIVRGRVESGDYLVASDEIYCVPVKPEEITFEEYKRCVGTAWTNSPDVEDLGQHRVLCAIGIK